MGKLKIFKIKSKFWLCIIVSLWLVIMSIVGYTLVDRSTKNTIERNLNYFTEQSFYLIEERLALIEQIMIEVSSNRKIQKWLELDKDNFDVLERANMISEISNFTAGANYIRNIFIYNKKQDYVVTESCFSNDVDIFLEYILEIQSLKRSETKKILLKIDDIMVFEYEKMFSNNSFLVLAPLYNNELKQNCVIGVVVEAQFLKDILERVKINNNCILAITSENGRIISSSSQIVLEKDIFEAGNDNFFEWNDIRYRTYCSSSDRYRINYYNFIPDNVFVDETVLVGGFFISLILISFILLLTLIGLFSKKNYKILNAFIGRIRNINPDIEGEEVGYINAAIDGLCLEEKRIDKLIQENRNVLKEVSARKLIKGSGIQEDNANNLMNYLNPNIENLYKLVAVFLLKDENREMADWLVIEINQCLEGCFATKEEHVVAAVFVNKEDSFEYISSVIMPWTKYIYRVGVGTTCIYPDEIKKSYMEAMESVRYVTCDQAEFIVKYEHIKNFVCHEEFIVWDSGPFIELITNKNVAEAVNLLEKKIENEFTKSRYIKEESLQKLIYGVANDVKKALDISENVALMEERELLSTNIFDLKKIIKDYLICVGEACSKKLDNNEYNRVIKYISTQKGFDFDLNQIALDLELNPSYLSRWFKECIGETYTEYIKRLKINEVKRLLTESELSLKEIALKVNYSSDSALAKAFKKETGLTPQTYRKLKGDKREEQKETDYYGLEKDT